MCFECVHALLEGEESLAVTFHIGASPPTDSGSFCEALGRGRVSRGGGGGRMGAGAGWGQTLESQENRYKSSQGRSILFFFF